MGSPKNSNLLMQETDLQKGRYEQDEGYSEEG